MLTNPTVLSESIAFFLGVSILFYCLFAGADFGAGILGLFRGRTLREDQYALMSHAIGPVWEANHVWLILAVVILMNGFPRAYAEVSTVFHIPLTLMLLGVILRGCSFTFSHYDAVRDSSQNVYTTVFVLSSVLAPLMLGVVAGALLLGRVTPDPSFVGTYVLPWFNLFSFSVGVFTCVLFAFLAAVYLIGEAKTEPLRKLFIRRAQAANLVAVITGSLVFLSGHFDEFPLIPVFMAEPLSLACMIAATLILVPLWMSLHHRNILYSRIAAGTQVMLILMGWFWLQFPVIMARRGSLNFESLTIYNSAAPHSTLLFLLGSLGVGSILIFPALFFLIRIFKGKDFQPL